MTGKSVSEIVARCEELYEDLNFTAAREWKDAEPGRKVIGYMPVYVPRELIHAAGMLPMGIMGGGDNLEVIHGDAYYQSYICRIPRSTIELGVSGRVDFVDGMLFPSICDVIRNLSGMWKMLFPDVYSKYFDVPQTYKDEIGGVFYTGEMREFLYDLENIGGRKISDDDIRASIEVYNENRRAIGELYALRAAQPWKAPASEAYLIMRAGLVIPVEEHTVLVRDYIAAATAEDRPIKDNSRVVLTGMFCEQPPLNLIKSLELSGCYIVDDDFVLISRWLLGDVPSDGDPMHNLSQAFLHSSMSTAAKYEPDQAEKGQFLVRAVRDTGAEGVIFASTSFCDPALLDRPILQNVLKEANVPFIAFKYAENSGQMQPIREQAGTFVDSIKLWSAA
ncbi:MAG: benzoyl-CoA reductase subunit C [Halieaceae bacterium]|uniref:benzoyl-CoA reductase subunit C n=1 Tax=Pseudopelagicola sp. nBUS_20 TaxID=3395317 RepID=UPI003EB8BF92|nr:benzoyl-CoA reductase subunit C [Halieaceae bacterium]MCP4767129.1 benzoyl-CoA reductase subunit C [Gammaproteobacteria bacterium]